MNPNKVLWEKGDFTRIADTMRKRRGPDAALRITKGLMVLDLGCGDRRPFFHSLFNENRASQTGFADVT
jgi:hypothetical protein